MKKIIILGAFGLSLIACTAIETQNKVTLKDGTKINVGVAIATTGSAVSTNGGF